MGAVLALGHDPYDVNEGSFFVSRGHGVPAIRLDPQLANYLPFVALLIHRSYIDELSSPRVSTGVVLAAALCLPQLLELGSTARAWFWAAAALWLSSLPALLSPALVGLLNTL